MKGFLTFFGTEITLLTVEDNLTWLNKLYNCFTVNISGVGSSSGGGGVGGLGVFKTFKSWKKIDKNNLNFRSYYDCTKLNKASNKQYIILITFNVQYSCSLSNISVIRPLSSTYLFNNISAISWRSLLLVEETG